MDTLKTLDCSSNNYSAENPANGRYYQAYIVRDLLNDWVVVTRRGNKSWRTGIQKNYLCASYAEALKWLAAIKKIRRRHGYLPI
jgi:hypothetical protein